MIQNLYIWTSNPKTSKTLKSLSLSYWQLSPFLVNSNSVYRRPIFRVLKVKSYFRDTDTESSDSEKPTDGFSILWPACPNRNEETIDKSTTKTDISPTVWLHKLVIKLVIFVTDKTASPQSMGPSSLWRKCIHIYEFRFIYLKCKLKVRKWKG